MARVKYYDPKTGKWEYADSSFVVGNGTDSGGNVDLAITRATVGQTVKITEVDENGAPTAWESVDFPSGGVGGIDARETICEGTLDYSVAATKHELPVTIEKLREYKVFMFAFNVPVSTNYVIRLGTKRRYQANGHKSMTLLFEWMDSAKTILNVFASSGFFSNTPFDTVTSPIQLMRSVAMPYSFTAVDVGNEISLELSVAQSSDVQFMICGVLK